MSRKAREGNQEASPGSPDLGTLRGSGELGVGLRVFRAVASVTAPAVQEALEVARRQCDQRNFLCRRHVSSWDEKRVQ